MEGSKRGGTIAMGLVQDLGYRALAAIAAECRKKKKLA